MAWRHPDVCNRHQKSSGPGEEGDPSWFSPSFCPGVLWEVVAKLVAQNLSAICSVRLALAR
ncbi:hypothetical protein CCMA1212_010697 [Trichoderma ghanense]|uniref:Uncharacterized protein n=1 Tax=Trichoderma ghanense TaxID=65468 RepID=A0ABY2GPR8_9HYPO